LPYLLLFQPKGLRYVGHHVRSNFKLALPRGCTAYVTVFQLQ